LFKIFISKDRKQNWFHTGAITEGPHRSSSSPDFHERSFNCIGGAYDRGSQFRFDLKKMKQSDERRRDEEPHRGYRSGYEPKGVRTSEGRVELKALQLRETLEPYRSKVVPLIGRKSSLLEHLVQEMYARGLSTRDIADLFHRMLRDRDFCLASAVSSEIGI
jgi:hypothetical protein